MISDTALQRVWEGIFLDKPVVMKQRFCKQYRHPVLDSKLTLGRLNQARHTTEMTAVLTQVPVWYGVHLQYPPKKLDIRCR